MFTLYFDITFGFWVQCYYVSIDIFRLNDCNFMIVNPRLFFLFVVFVLTLSAPIETKVDQSKNPSCTSISSQEGNLQHHKHESYLVL